jgi:CBS domain containing-hemolysin-like protein
MAEVDIMRNVLTIKDVNIEQIMSYKSTFVSAEFSENIEEMKKNLLNAGYRRKIVIWEDNLDNIIGTIDIRNFFISYVKNEIKEVKHFIQPPKFFIESSNIYQVLQYFQTTKNKIVFVINEYGVILGVVTVTDIFNEIIGNVEEDDELFQIIDQSNLLVDGMIHLRSLNKKMDWNLPEEFLTVSGLVMYLSKSVPSENDVFFYENFKFEIKKVFKNKISAVLITYLLETQS